MKNKKNHTQNFADREGERTVHCKSYWSPPPTKKSLASLKSHEKSCIWDAYVTGDAVPCVVFTDYALCPLESYSIPPFPLNHEYIFFIIKLFIIDLSIIDLMHFVRLRIIQRQPSQWITSVVVRVHFESFPKWKIIKRRKQFLWGAISHSRKNFIKFCQNKSAMAFGIYMNHVVHNNLRTCLK